MKPKIKITAALIFLGLFLVVHIGQARFVNCGETFDNPNPCTLLDLIQTVVNVINFLLAWAWLVAIFFIAYSGFNMVGTAGNEENIKTAKDGFKNAIIGFVLIMIAYILINWIVAALTGGSMTDALQMQNIINLLRP